MPLNDNTVKYVPTSAKTGAIVSLCIVDEVTDVERVGAGGIIETLYNPNKSFVGAVIRTPHDISNCGLYNLYNEEDMVDIRLAEQKKAANIGSYNSLYVLNYTDLSNKGAIIDDLIALIKAYRPEKIYTYSPYEKDREKVQTVLMLIEALSRIDEEYRPQLVVGAAISRELSFLPTEQVLNLGIDSKIDLAYSLLDIYDSVIENNEELMPADCGIDLTGIKNIESLREIITENLNSFLSKTLANLE